MRWDPMFDPFVEYGYLGYAMRCVAHRQPDATYQPSLQVRDYRDASGALLFECIFPEVYPDADSAMRLAVGKGHQIVENLLEAMNVPVLRGWAEPVFAMT